MTIQPGPVDYNGQLYLLCKSRALDGSLWYSKFNGQTWSAPITFDGQSSVGASEATVYVSANNAGLIDTYDEIRSPAGQITVTPVANSLHTGQAPQPVVASADGKRVYVADALDNRVTVIDSDPASATHNTVVATALVGMAPLNLAISGDGTIVCSSNSLNNTATVISVPATL